MSGDVRKTAGESRAVRRAFETDLDIRQLRAFVALVDYGSVTAAARAIHLAQSTVSESLAGLERALGVRVLVRRRGARRPALTSAGHALLPRARDVLAAIDTARAAVANVATDAHAIVSIIANESVSTYMLPRVIARLRKRWPSTRFTVSVATCAGVRAGVADGSFDAGLLLEPCAADPARFVARRGSDRGTEERIILGNDVPLIVFAAPTHPLATARRADPVRRAAFAECQVFISDAAGDFHSLLRGYFSGEGMLGASLEATGSVEGVKRAVATEPNALGVLPAYAIADEIASGAAVRVSVRPNPPRMKLAAIASVSRPRHPSVDAMFDALRDEATARPQIRDKRR